MSLFGEPLCSNVSAPVALSFTTATISGLLCLVTVPGNLLVLLAVFIDPYKELKYPFNYFIVNLAITDLIAGLIVEPISFVFHVKEAMGTWDGNIAILHMPYFVTCTASVLSLGALAVERYLAVQYEMKYRTELQLKPMRVLVVSLVIWTFSLSFPFIYFRTGYIGYSFVFNHTAVILTFAVLSFTYASIFKKLRDRVRQWDNIVDTMPENQAKRQAVRDQQKLSEAYCLLWQDSSTGNVDGRQGSKRKLGGAVFAVLMDLLVLGKIKVDVVEKKFLGIKYRNRNIVVKDPSPTDSYLDRALFNKIVEKHKQGRVREIEDWVRDCITTYNIENNVASVSLENLVRRDILGKERVLLGFSTDYPTKDPEPNRKLVAEIRKIALHGAQPDAYMRVLLTILRGTDNLYSFYDPLLERYFTSNEYRDAKNNIKKVVIYV